VINIQYTNIKQNNLSLKVEVIFIQVLVLLLLKTSNAATQINDEGIIVETSIEGYVNSKTCVECYQSKYEDWSGKHMSHFAKYFQEDTW